MIRSLRIVVPALLALCYAAPANADWLKDFFTSVADDTRYFSYTVVRDTKRRNCWPKPFVSADRRAVRAPFLAMVSNGWERQNMLGDHHFGEDGAQLTEAGLLKVRWILVEAPKQHRSIYVHIGEDAEQTAARIAAVQQRAAEFAINGQMPPVLESRRSDQGWPASQVDVIGRKFSAATPDPVLPPIVAAE